MKLNLPYNILLLTFLVSFYSEVSARESVGTLNVYRANKDLVIHGSRYKKGAVVANDDYLVMHSDMEYKYLSFEKKKNYYMVEPIVQCAGVPYVKIAINNITKETYNKYRLFTSDVGGFATFVNSAGKKVRIFKCSLNGHKFFDWEKTITLKHPDIYLLCTDDYMVQLETKNDRFLLYDIDYDEEDLDDGYTPTGEGTFVPNAYLEESFDYYFDNNGNLLHDIEIIDGYFNNDESGNVQPIKICTIAYLHDRNELYIDGEFYKLQEIKNTPNNNETLDDFVHTEYKYKEKYVINQDGIGEYAGIGVEWPVSWGNRSVVGLQQALLEFALSGYNFYSIDKKANNIYELLNNYTNIENFKRKLEIPSIYSIAKGKTFDFETDYNFDFNFFCYIISYILDQAEDRYVTYCNKTAYCTGPGHMTYNYMIYDLKNDCKLTYDDIFINNSKSTVTTAIVQQLMKDYNVESFHELSDEIGFLDDITERNFPLTENIGFVNNSFIFTYAPLDITYGETENVTVTIPVKQLESALTQQAKSILLTKKVERPNNPR